MVKQFVFRKVNLVIGCIGMMIVIGMALSTPPMTISSAAEAATATAAPSTTLDFKTVEAAVTKLVSAANIREYAVCNLRAFYWGDHDGSVQVAANESKDGKSHLFSIKQGTFAEEITTTPISSPATTRGDTLVMIKTAEEAFKKGVPYFITDASLDSAKKISYTLISNPDVVVKGAYPTLEFHTDTTFTQVFGTTHPINASAKPQKLSFEHSAELESGYFSIVTPISGTYSHCLQSNHIDWGALTVVANTDEAPGIDTPLKVQDGTIQVTALKHMTKLDMGGGFEVKAHSGYELVMVSLKVEGKVPLAGDASQSYQNGKWALVDAKGTRYQVAGLVSGALMFEVKQPLAGLVLALGDEAQISLDPLLKAK
ncbi:MAG: hypothetical protein KF716_17260 [Anaerolineae bacterium]|nr:hypothetical protein [Anaerolineae bacterium]